VRFVDEVEITVSSGKGGDGCVSFRRESRVPRGGPNGGNGGRGGSIVIEATPNRNTLVDFRYKRIWRADDGQDGMGKDMYGADAPDKVLLVPIGTMVFDAETGELVADLDAEGARWTLEGGRGGRGNMHFATATRQTPTFAEPGKPGKEHVLRLELKLIADVGLLGFPNAGKSTLISRISAAKPKVADYPFTTLVPHLGVVSVGEGDSFVVADIPGLIEGAAEGKGLGHQFLRHVERCHLYLHLVAPYQPDGDPVQCLRVLNEELARYDELAEESGEARPTGSLSERAQIVVLTKIDSLSPEERAQWIAALEAERIGPVFAISAVTGEGVEQLVWATWERVREGRGTPEEDDDSRGQPTL
jgi:GTP-binding protein